MSKTVEFRMAAGVRNDVDLERFDRDEDGRYTGKLDLASSTNLDLDETGRLFRRLGTKRLLTGNCHSLFAFDDMAYVVKDGVLCALDLSMSLTPIQPVSGRRVSYTLINGLVYWSDDRQSGVLNGAVNTPWGIQPPSKLNLSPTLGDMRGGRYLCTVTFVRSTGEESGAPGSAEIVLVDNQGIKFNDIPVSSDPLVVTKRIYVTPWNGEVPLLTMTLGNSDRQATLGSLPQQGMAVRTQFKGPMPKGRLVRYFAGRAYVASGGHLWYSEPYEYGLCDLRSGFVSFDSKVTMFAPVSNGVYVGSNRAAYWLEGRDPTTWERRQISQNGAVLGSECHLHNDLVGQGVEGKVVGWMSTKGFYIGFEGGQARNVTGGRYIPPVATEGASMMKIRGGTPQIVTTLFS